MVRFVKRSKTFFNINFHWKLHRLRYYIENILFLFDGSDNSSRHENQYNNCSSVLSVNRVNEFVI